MPVFPDRLSVRRSLTPLAFVLFAIGCSDGTGLRPLADSPTLNQAPHFLRWAGRTPQFSAFGALARQGTSSAAAGVSASGPAELSLENNSASFWAVRGQDRSVQINYRSAIGDGSSPFLHLSISDPVYVPGRGDLAQGDSVLITVNIDPQNIEVSLEPTGLLFGNPSQLSISYGGAGGDLNGDGVVDTNDADIESRLLGMWYREDATDPWAPIASTREISEKSIGSSLQHFSTYAVSW